MRISDWRSDVCSSDLLAADFRKLEASAEVHHILIVADSPGGQITDVRAFAQLIANSSKPVTVFVSGLCCSATYHICSAAKEIVADPFALVGSLGVMIGGSYQEIGRAHVRTPVTNAHRVCGLLLEKKKQYTHTQLYNY